MKNTHDARFDIVVTEQMQMWDRKV